MSVATVPVVRVGPGSPPVATRFVKGRSGHPGGRIPLGTASLRRRMRDAFKENDDRNLCKLAIEAARGDDIAPLVAEMVRVSREGGMFAGQILAGLGKTLATLKTNQLAAIEFCKRVGFGADPKPIDDSAAAELVATMLEAARARAAERAAALPAATTTNGEAAK